MEKQISYSDLEHLEQWNNLETQTILRQFFELMMKPIAKVDQQTQSWLPLSMHLLDCLGIMQCMIREWIPEHIVDILNKRTQNKDFLETILLFLALIHDLGKDTVGFQTMLKTHFEPENWPGESIDAKNLHRKEAVHHSKATELILSFSGFPDSLNVVAGAHHGYAHALQKNPQDFFEANSQSFFGNRNHEATLEQWKHASALGWIIAQMLAGTFQGKWDGNWKDVLNELDQIPKFEEEDQVLISGLLIMADWISSNTDLFPLLPVDSQPDFSVYPNRVERAWKKAQLPERLPEVILDELRPQPFRETFSHLFGFHPYPMQVKMMETAQQLNQNPENGKLLILEAPMGMGKTEAALGAAEVFFSQGSYHGLFFGLPTQATANGLFSRAADFSKKTAGEAHISIFLAHSQRNLNPEFRSIMVNTHTYDSDLMQGHDTEEENKADGLYTSDWMKRNKTSLLSNIVVGTVDQLLMSVLKGRHFMLRHIGLAGKVVIIDEVHAYDAYMNTLLDTALTWLGRYRVPVILLSATLPAGRRADLVKAYCEGIQKPEQGLEHELEAVRNCRSYPLLTWSNGLTCKTENFSIQKEDMQSQHTADKVANGSVMKEVRIERLNLGFESLQKEILTHYLQGERVGVIVNTVQEAQELYDSIRHKIQQGEIPTTRSDLNMKPDLHDLLLIHSRFTQSDRAYKEETVKRWIGKDSIHELHPCIIIGTQVLEQSLDIDFDALFTDICPMDLLLQRIGRLFRHDGRVRPSSVHGPVCYLIHDQIENLNKGTLSIYGNWLLHQTLHLLPEKIRIPDDIPSLVNGTYSPLEERVTQQQSLGSYTVTDNLKKNDHEDSWPEYNEELNMAAMEQNNKKQKAEPYQIGTPKPIKIGKIRRNRLDTRFRDIFHNEFNCFKKKDAVSLTRDSDFTIEVCLLRKDSDFPVQVLSIQANSNDTYSLAALPSEDQQLAIVSQKVRLPRNVFYEKGFGEVFNALTEIKTKNFSAWKNAHLLKNEFFLVLDQGNKAQFLGFEVHYNSDHGLTLTKMDD